MSTVSPLVFGLFSLLKSTAQQEFLNPAMWLRLTQEKPVPKKQLQLVGVTAMFLASKYEEMYPPEISDFAYVTDRAYTTAQIRDMEMTILRVLKFQLGRPLPLQFLRRASKIHEVRSCSLNQQAHDSATAWHFTSR